MDDMDAFDRQIAREVLGAVRPPRHVDHLAIFTAITATQSPKWRFQTMFSATKFVVAGAIVALFGGFLLSGVLTQPSDELAPAAATTSGPGTFSPTDSLDEARSGHTATLLPDGRVLVVGGDYPDEEGDSVALHAVAAVVWDPETASFSPAGPLIEARSGHTATSLPDGRVLIVGGYAYDDCDGYCLHNIADAEVWDPETASFSPAGSLAKERGGHTATLLPDGRVLIVGGVDGYGMITSAEVWDPETASFSSAGSLARAMAGHTAALRPDGSVLIVGAMDRVSALASAEVWDPEAAAFVPIGSFGSPDDGYSATNPAFAALPDGRVLIAGGGYIADANGVDEGYEVVATAAIWDPETASFDVEGSLIEAREGHTATLLPDGRVLVIGGWDGEDGKRASAEVWDPETASFSPAGSLAEGREHHTATPLPDGRVLIVGGMGADSLLASAEVWSP